MTRARVAGRHASGPGSINDGQLECGEQLECGDEHKVNYQCRRLPDNQL
jgi:hypothetical protein